MVHTCNASKEKVNLGCENLLKGRSSRRRKEEGRGRKGGEERKHYVHSLTGVNFRSYFLLYLAYFVLLSSKNYVLQKKNIKMHDCSI